jgi:hypothetical protein
MSDMKTVMASVILFPSSFAFLGKRDRNTPLLTNPRKEGYIGVSRRPFNKLISTYSLPSQFEIHFSMIWGSVSRYYEEMMWK